MSGMGRIWVLLPDPNSLTIDAEREDGISEGRSVALQFGAHVREQWDLFDSEGAVVANVWDVFVERWKSHVAVGTLRMETGADRFVILEGIKFRIKALSVEVIATPHDVPFEVDMLKLSIGYENAVTGKMLMVPMPPSWLELRREHGGE